MQSKNRESKKRVVDSLEEKNFIVLVMHLIYRLVGRKILQRKSFRGFFYKNIYNSKYENILKKANLKILPEEYFLSIYLIIILTIFLIVVLTILFIFINSVISALIFYGGVILLSFMGGFMYNYPIILAKSRGDEIDASIPYLLPYMKILSKELNLSKIIILIEQFLIYRDIRIEFRKIKYYSEFLGYDIHTSIREAMQSCPSKQLSDMMNDLVTISNSGGDIYSYLDRKLDNLNTEIDAIEQKNIDTLLIYSQIYVVVLLIAPLFFTIMSTILNLVEFSADIGSSGGVDDTFLTILFVLLGLPFLYVGFMMLIYYTKPLYARLKPIKNEFD